MRLGKANLEMKLIPPIAHDLDAGWLIALWKAIHGGDPAIDQVDVQTAAGQIIAQVSQYAFGAAAAVNAEDFASRLGSVRLSVGRPGGGVPGDGVQRDAIVRREGTTIFMCYPLGNGDYLIIERGEALLT
jgi:hypothetical protein